MNLVKVTTDALKETIDSQWKNVITVCPFDDKTVVSPGVVKLTKTTAIDKAPARITNGSLIQVPENTAAFIYINGRIEQVIMEPGSYEFNLGRKSIFNGDSFVDSIISETASVIGFGGVQTEENNILYVNLHELRDLKFGTNGPVLFNDSNYNYEVYAYGSFSITISDPVKLVINYLPEKTNMCSSNDPFFIQTLRNDLLQLFKNTLNNYTGNISISELTTMSGAIANDMLVEATASKLWDEKFGIKLMSVTIDNVELSDKSKRLLNREKSIISEQNQDNKSVLDILEGKANVIDKQIDILQKLKQAYEMGVLTEEEYNEKKNDILDL